MVIVVAGEGRVALKTSALVMTIFTGLPVFSAEGDNRRQLLMELPPKLPPTSTGMTLTRRSGRPRYPATNSLTLKMLWLPSTR